MTTVLGAALGVPFTHILAGSDEIGPEFRASLLTSVIADIGDYSPTFVRATAATIPDWELLIKDVLSGETRHPRARRAQNRCENYPSNDITTWNDNGTNITIVDSNTARTSGDGSEQVLFNRTLGTSLPLNSDLVWTVDLLIPLGEKIELRVQGNGPSFSNIGQVTIVGDGTRHRYTTSANNGATDWSSGFRGLVALPPGFNTSVFEFEIYEAMLEVVTGQADKNPSEWVSRGDGLTSPFHGVMVDGVKNFGYENGNTVDANNVVTEAKGAALNGIMEGYLPEDQRTNDIVDSNDFAGAGFTRTRTTSAADVEDGPDGGLDTASDIVATSVSGTHHLISTEITKAAAIERWTASIYAKLGDNVIVDGVRITVSSTTSVDRGWADIDLTDGSFLGISSTGTYTAVAGGVEPAGNGFYRVWVTVDTDAVASVKLQIFLLDGGNQTFTGDDSSGIFVYGAQLELGDNMSSYIPTTGTAETRNKDVLTYPDYQPDALNGSALCEFKMNSGHVASGYLAVANVNARFLYFRASDAFTYDGTTIFRSNIGLNDGQTYHAGVSWEDGASPEVGLYLDGVLVDSGVMDVDGYAGATGLAIGVDPGGSNDSQPNAPVKNVSFYASALSQIDMESATS